MDNDDTMIREYCESCGHPWVHHTDGMCTFSTSCSCMRTSPFTKKMRTLEFVSLTLIVIAVLAFAYFVRVAFYE